jgi:ubiquinone/menaquinone biosynthesis C-methylase UbiE
VTGTSSKHWDGVYSTKQADQVSWFRPHLERSLSFVDRCNLPHDAGVIDVGGGASSFVDDLLQRGYSNLTVLDLSGTALEVAKQRLGERSSAVHWLAADVTEIKLPRQRYAFWHDRAVFHFLTQASQREKYVAAVRRALEPGGHIVIATFGANGPKQCSGLDVIRMSADDIHSELGAGFTMVGSETEIHSTPWGSPQEFTYCHCRRSE